MIEVVGSYEWPAPTYENQIWRHSKPEDCSKSVTLLGLQACIIEQCTVLLGKTVKYIR